MEIVKKIFTDGLKKKKSKKCKSKNTVLKTLKYAKQIKDKLRIGTEKPVLPWIKQKLILLKDRNDASEEGEMLDIAQKMTNS